MPLVCQVISGYHRNDARIFRRQSISLKNSGFNVTVLTNDGLEGEVVDGIKFIKCEKRYARTKELLLATKQFKNKAFEINADIYVLHSPELLPLGIKLRKAGKIVVYDAHEDLPRHILEKEWVPKVFRKPLSFAIEKYMNYALAKFNAVITPLSHIIDHFRIINSNTLLVANFPIIKPFAKFTLEEYCKREPIICYSGTAYRYSNQIAILDAIQSIENVSYEIAGHIDEELFAQMKSHTAKSKFSYLGRINSVELDIFYSKMRVGLVIYDYKLNLGYKLGSYGTNKIFEYMEAALPIICTDYELWKNIVDKYNCGICIQPGDTKQIYEAISFLLNNPEEAYRMGQNSRRAVENEFNWQTHQKDFLKLFKFNNDL